MIQHYAPAQSMGEAVTSLEVDGFSCAGEDRLLLVAVSYLVTDQEALSVFFDGLPLNKVSSCTLGGNDTQPGVCHEVWALENPPVGPSSVTAAFSGEVRAIVSALALSGVNQDDPIYCMRDAVGDGVDVLALGQVEFRNGSALICFEARQGEVSATGIDAFDKLWAVGTGYPVTLFSQAFLMTADQDFIGTAVFSTEASVRRALNLIGVQAA